MRTFSKLLLAAGAIFAVASCQTAEESFAPAGKLKVTASFENASTRVTYNIDNTSNTITPSWTLGDEIFGWDNTGVTFTFTCTGVDGNNEASFNYDQYVPADGTTLYAIYYPGKTATDIATDHLDVDLTTQEGSLDKDAPVLMSATATVSGETIHFSFHNDAVIVGLKKFKVGANDQVNSVTIKGLSATGTYEVNNDGKLVLTPATMASDITATVKLTANNDSIVETPVYFAALPTAETSLTVSAITAAGTNYVATKNTSAKEFRAGKYYYMTKILEAEAEESVIEVPSVEYESIDAAFAFAQISDSPCTIKLISDCTLSDTLAYAKGNTTLDLNGKTLEYNNGTVINVTGGTLTIEDSTADNKTGIGEGVLQSTKSPSCAVTIERGEVNFLSGYVFAKGTTNAANAFRLNANNGAATLNIKGGHLKSCQAIQLNQNSTTYEATVNITGGLVESDANGAQFSPIYLASSQGGTVNISGGTLKTRTTATNTNA